MDTNICERYCLHSNIIFDLSSWTLLIPHHFFMQDSLLEKTLSDMTSYSHWLWSDFCSLTDLNQLSFTGVM